MDFNIRIVKAENIPPKDINGSSDPYIIAKIGERHYRTKTVSKNLFPTWNEVFHFTGVGPDAHLDLELYDNDCLTSDNKISKYCIPMNTLKSGEVQDNWYDFESSSHLFTNGGRVNVVFQLAPPGTAPFEAPKPGMDLHLKIVKAENIPPKDINGSADPYIIAKILNKEIKTKTIPKNLAPEWNEEFHFTEVPPDAILELQLLDSDMLISHDSISTYQIRLAELKPGKVTTNWYDFKSTNPICPSGGHVNLVLQLTEPGKKPFEECCHDKDCHCHEKDCHCHDKDGKCDHDKDGHCCHDKDGKCDKDKDEHCCHN